MQMSCQTPSPQPSLLPSPQPSPQMGEGDRGIWQLLAGEGDYGTVQLPASPPDHARDKLGPLNLLLPLHQWELHSMKLPLP